MLKIILIAGLILISGCIAQEKSVNQSIEEGLKYLDGSYSNFNYADPYLEFVYPGEELNCEIQDCDLTYRMLDAYFNVYFVKDEFTNSNLIRRQINDADLVFDTIIPEWRAGEIYNSRKSNSDEGFALDTYCIFAYVTKDEQMNEVILRYLDDDYRWGIDVDTLGEDNWRLIADETWCSRALMNTEDKELIDKIVDKQVEDMKVFLVNGNDLDNSGALYHTLFVLHDYEKKFGNKYSEEKNEFAQELVGILRGNEDLLININSLDVLSKINYPDEQLLKEISREIVNEQEIDGSWDISIIETAPVFITFRAVIALNAYENEIKN